MNGDTRTDMMTACLIQDGHDEARSVIVDAMARTLFVCDWAFRVEERNPRAMARYAGCDLLEVAPPTPHRTWLEANCLAQAIEGLNGETLDQMYIRALR